MKFEYIPSFLAGIGVGVAATLMLAPQSGRNTRNNIRDMARRVGDELKQRSANLAEEAAGAYDRSGARDRVKDLKNQAKQGIDNAAAGARKVADKVADKSKDATEAAGRKMEELATRL